MIHASYNHTLHELEQMPDEDLSRIAVEQAINLKTATLEQTLTKLKGWLNDRNSRRA
jgi:hypothetical protein